MSNALEYLLHYSMREIGTSKGTATFDQDSSFNNNRRSFALGSVRLDALFQALLTEYTCTLVIEDKLEQL